MGSMEVDAPGKDDLEAECGISAFASALPGFTGILKHRYRDFQVTEVDAQGRLANLTSLSLPPQPEPLPFESLPGSEAAIASAFKHVAGPHAAKQLHSLLRAISRTYYSKAPPQAPAQLGESQSGGEQGAAPLAEAAAPLAEAQAADASKPAAGSEAAAAAAAVTATGGVAASAPGGSGEDVGVEDSAVEQGPHGELSIILEPIADKNARKAVHEFFKSDPKVPPLMTGIVDEAAVRPASSSKPQGEGNGTQGTQGTQGSGQPTPPSTGRIFIKYTPTRTQRREATASSAGQSETAGHPGTEATGGPDSANGREGRGGGGRGARGGKGGGGRREGRGRGGRGDAQQSQQWGGGSDCKHVKFVLYKENQDTQAALAAISRTLRLGGPGSNQRSVFGFAGTKDKRGLTSQFVTAFKLHPARLAALNGNTWLRGLSLGNFEYCAIPLRLGHLAGNCFNLLMRNVVPEEEGVSASELEQRVHASCAAVAVHGFVNYFGLQRFGTAGTPTHKVGAALLQGRFGAAVDLIMGDGFEDRDGSSGGRDSNNSSSSRGDPGHQQQKAPVREARAAWLERRDPKAALRLLPHWMVGERSLMEGLARKQQQQQGSKRGGGPAGPQQGQNKRVKGNDGQKRRQQQGQEQQQGQQEQGQQEHGQQQLGKEQEHEQKLQQADQQPQQQQPHLTEQREQQAHQPIAAGMQEDARSMQVDGATSAAGAAAAPATAAPVAAAAAPGAPPAPATGASAAAAAAPTDTPLAEAAPGAKGSEQRDKDPNPEAKPQAPFSESDFAGVLCMLPHSLRLMYLHAWQSRLWNLAASHRVKVYGADRVVEGDLVLPRPSAPSSQRPAASSGLNNASQLSAEELVALSGEGGGDEGEMEGEGAEEGRDGEEATAQGCAQPGSGAPAPADVDSGSGNGPAGGVGATMPAPAASSGKGDGVTRRDGGKHVHTSAARLAAVHVVTAQEAEEGKFSIEDVVLPMPGVRVQYPKHSTRDVYMTTAAQDGVDLELRSPPAHKMRVFALEALGGDYRRVVMRPRGFEWELIRYSDPNDDSLLQSPLERLHQLQQQQQLQEAGPLPPPPPPPPLSPEELKAQQQLQQQGQTTITAASSLAQQPIAPPVRGQGPLLGLRLQFLLPASTYATMLIRELTRQSTSRAFQSSLSGAAPTTVPPLTAAPAPTNQQ